MADDDEDTNYNDKLSVLDDAETAFATALAAAELANAQEAPREIQIGLWRNARQARKLAEDAAWSCFLDVEKAAGRCNNGR